MAQCVSKGKSEVGFFFHTVWFRSVFEKNFNSGTGEGRGAGEEAKLARASHETRKNRDYGKRCRT